MELGSVVEFLEHKTILVTGVTGFLGKVFVEKMLRVQPNVKKLYLLLRAADIESATIRFHNEVLGKELFRIFKEKWSTHDLNSFISEKITLVPGDITREDLGLKDYSNLKQEMCNDLDLIINSAAMTKFHERYDAALGINTLGALHIVNFAKKCIKLKVLVHVSTAYVSLERQGLILENSYQIGETLNGESNLNIDVEKNLVEQEMNKLKAEGASEKEITVAMKDLGINRTMDIFLALHAQGKLPYLLGDPKSVLDVIPVDMVVNAMIVAMVSHARQPSATNIYQVGSSLRNPITLRNVLDYNFHYFTKNPWINNDGKCIKIEKVTILNNLDSFHKHMEKIQYLSPSKVCSKHHFSYQFNIFDLTLTQLFWHYLIIPGRE
ncbi:Fatty acyl-CoA reductase [Melia azedarach]|uniref:Fatty acyl-CoA reductase n=1 Tax=Melia azedarach TaxID=155640 RepID=A0ACC1Y8D8_MELAZ|nr:Fatty acyl-CoA reductase [Melia azedarach]